MPRKTLLEKVSVSALILSQVASPITLETGRRTSIFTAEPQVRGLLLHVNFIFLMCNGSIKVVFVVVVVVQRSPTINRHILHTACDLTDKIETSIRAFQ